MRGVSAVLDASLCLLLVAASAATLAGTPVTRPTDPAVADETAEMVATSTARVTYRTGDGGRRTAHDTLAGLLASAAVADARRQTTTDFVERVTVRVGRALRRAGVDAQVVARLRSRNATRDSRVVAGDAPPPNADVHAAELVVRRVRLTVRTWSR